MSLFQITVLVLLCVCVSLNLMGVYMDRAKWLNAFVAGLCTGGILHIIADIIYK